MVRRGRMDKERKKRPHRRGKDREMIEIWRMRGDGKVYIVLVVARYQVQVVSIVQCCTKMLPGTQSRKMRVV